MNVALGVRLPYESCAALDSHLLDEIAGEGEEGFFNSKIAEA